MECSQLPVSPLRRPKAFNFATHVVDHWAEKLPSQNALYWVSQDLSTSRQFTYGHFSKQSHRIAVLLSSLGIKQGEVCVIVLPRLPEWWEIVTACLRSGIIPCPCTTLLVDKDIEYRLKVSNAAVFIGDPVSVSKCVKVRENCPGLRTVIQIDGASSSSSSTSTSNSTVIHFHTSLSSISQSARSPHPPTLKPTSPGLIFFTSGTTGPPKMVLHSQTSYPLALSLLGVHWLRLSPTSDSIYWNLSEQGWAKASWSFFSTWNCGATLFVHDDRKPFAPKRTLDVLHRFPISTMCAPPTVYRQLVTKESQEIYKSQPPLALRHVCGAGEPLNESVIHTWKEMTSANDTGDPPTPKGTEGGLEICDGYGQTETILLCANQAGIKVKPGSMGKPIPGVPLRLLTATATTSGTGGSDSLREIDRANEEGDIAIEVSHVAEGEEGFFGFFDGYVRDIKSMQLDQKIVTTTVASTNGKLQKKSYYITGDRATRDIEGYITFVGRNDDVINSSGYRIGPFEVESTLKQHPSVLESAVVASPDPDRDEIVKAFVVLTEKAFHSLSSTSNKKLRAEAEEKLIKELQDFCKHNAAPYKYPRKIELVDAAFLPKTISGKIRRAELKKLERERYINNNNEKRGQGAKL